MSFSVAWKTKTIKELCEIGDGNHSSKYPKKSEMQSSGVPFIRGTNLINGEISSEDILYISEEKHQQLKKGHLKEGDVLFTNRGEIGKVAVVDSRFDGANLNSQIAWLRSGEEIIPQYLFYYLQSPKLTNYYSNTKSGAALQQFTIGMLKEVEVLLPDVEEQKRIVAILDEAFAGIDTAIANTQKNLANARELFESYLNSIFLSNNESWVRVSLGDIAEFKNGLNFTKHSKGEVVRYVGVGDFQANFYVPFNNLGYVKIGGTLREDYQIKKNDILIVRSNGSKDLVGRCMLVPEIKEKTSFSGFIIKINFDEKQVAPMFLLWFMKSKKTVDRLIGEGGGANINNINQKKLSFLPVGFPESLSEQKRIVDSIEELSMASKSIEAIYIKKIESLQELKQSLLQKAFSGELTSSIDQIIEEAVA